MATKSYKPSSPGVRARQVVSGDELTGHKPHRKLLVAKSSSGGRNNLGRVTVRFRGGGRKKKYRMIDFRRSANPAAGKVLSVEYDPNRSGYISLISYENGTKGYILAPTGLAVGQDVQAGENAEIKTGNSLKLKDIPTGSTIYNIELHPGKGGQLVRAAGASATLMAKSDNYVTVKLPSGEVRLINSECEASLGSVSNSENRNKNYGKAGARRWKGFRPHVRGSVMNPCDHPHGGGEGKAPIGRSGPMTPWGKPTLGKKTRHNKRTGKFIVKRRK